MLFEKIIIVYSEKYKPINTLYGQQTEKNLSFFPTECIYGNYTYQLIYQSVKLLIHIVYVRVKWITCHIVQGGQQCTAYPVKQSRIDEMETSSSRR